MKNTRIFSLVGFIVVLGFAASAQELEGSWQLLKESNCFEESASLSDDSLGALREEMHQRSGVTPRVIRFKGNLSGEESTRILFNSKSANSRKFLYKFNGRTLLILDKKSQTISDNFTVEKFTADSLIVSNSRRPCETRVFVKINE